MTKTSRKTKTLESNPDPSIYRLTFERDPRQTRPDIPPPLFIRVARQPTAAIEVSLDLKKWSPVRWTTNDAQDDSWLLVMLVINEIPEPRKVAQVHLRRGRLWLDLTAYNMTAAEIEQGEARVLAKMPAKAHKK